MQNPAAAVVAFLLAVSAVPASAEAASLRFLGHGSGGIDRVEIPIDAPAVPADVGGDFTIELWMKALPGENAAAGCVAGNDGWINGNIVVDRDVFGPGELGDYGLSLFADGIAFGVATSSSGGGLCGTTPIADGTWHHVAVTRDESSGALRLYDGALDAVASGPSGDVSYADGRTGAVADPFLVLGAEKHDAGPAYPSFSGWIDELRLSSVVRYAASFPPPSAPFDSDAGTVALYRFDEGTIGPCTGTVLDSSGAPGGPSHGACRFGGSGTGGPRYSSDVPGFGGAAADRIVAGRSLVVRDDATRPARRKIALTAVDPEIAPPLAGGADDPRTAGAMLAVGRGSEEVDAIDLPAAGWKGLGTPAGSRGYRYADSRLERGPCKSVVIRAGRVTATCVGAQVALTLDEPGQGAVGVGFRPGGGRRTCLEFGGVVTKDVAAVPGRTGWFKARNAAAPLACPLP